MTPSKLTPDDLRFVVSRLPKDVRKLMELHAGILFLGGGFIRARVAGEKPSDIDLFIPNLTTADHLANELAVERKAKILKTDNAITLTSPPRLPVQFITRWLYDEPQAVIESFDFTIAQAVIWCEPRIVPALKDGTGEASAHVWCSLIHPQFYADLAGKRLIYTFPTREEAAAGSLMRVRKFLYRGYNIQAPALAGVLSRVFAETINQAKEQVDWSERMEPEYLFRIIVGILREVDPLTIIDGVDAVDEHQLMRSLNIEGAEKEEEEPDAQHN